MATVKLDPAKGVQIPNMTTTERNAVSSPETGALVWNTTTSAVNQYNGSAWKEMLRSDGSAASLTAIPAANITGTLPAISGANLTGVGVDGIVSTANATAITIDSSESVGIDNSTGFGNYSGTGVKYAKGDGTLFIGRDGGVPLLINRETDQGDMIAFNVAGSSKVKIGTVSDGLFLGTGTGGNTKALTITSDRAVGIGTSSPDGNTVGGLHLYKGDSGAAAYSYAGLVLEAPNSHNWIQFKNPNTQNAGLLWSDPESSENATLWFNHNTAKMQAKVGNQLEISGGDIVFTTAGKGICLGVTSNTDANTLDDYEEGTYQPTFTGTSGGSWSTSAYTYLEYVKIGKLVHIQGYINVGSESSPSGNIIMSLPFTPTYAAQDSGNAAAVISMRSHGGSSLYNMTGSIAASGMQIIAVSAGGSGNWIDSGDIDAAFNIRISATYHAS